MKIKRTIASVMVAFAAMTGIGVAVAAPAQAHTTASTHWGNCYWSWNGDYWCQRHCSYWDISQKGCTNTWWYWKVNWNA